MKNLIFITLIFVSSFSVGQTIVEEANNISLSVILPNNSENLSQKAISKIESKIQHIVTRNGISGEGYSNEFLIYPKFEIFDESIIEGMRNIVVIDVEFNLFIQQYSTKNIFSSYHVSLKGSGTNRGKAIANAISKISVNDKNMKEFIYTGKEKIIEYYNNSCHQIVGDSDYLMTTQKYQQAIALLSSVPKEAESCYSAVQNKSIEAFNEYQRTLCKTNLLNAKTEISKNNYSKALNLLSYIDINSPCINEVESLIVNVSKEVDKKEKKNWDLMLKRQEDQQNIEKQRLNTIKEIAKSYYNSKPTTITYKSLF